jgi:DNA-binding transcriptional LysR family regulator
MAVFARVVDAQSFSTAARQLGLSKSAVSKQISALEDRLRARLLDRTTRRMALTETGRLYYDHAVRALAEAEAAEAAIGALHATPRGLLRLSLPVTFGAAHVAPVLADYLARYPDVQLQADFSDRHVDLLEDGYDMAIRIARMPDSSLVARRLAPSRIVVCAAPAYLEKYGTPLHPDDLRRHVCLGYAYSATPEEWLFQVNGRPHKVRVAGQICLDNGDAMRSMAVAGAGLIVSPAFIVGADVKAGRLTTLLHDFMPEAQTVYAVYPSRRHLTPKVRALIDLLAERFGPEPYWDSDCRATPGG